MLGVAARATLGVATRATLGVAARAALDVVARRLAEGAAASAGAGRFLNDHVGILNTKKAMFYKDTDRYDATKPHKT